MQREMTRTLDATYISTVVRFSIETILRRAAIRTTASLAPALASLWAERLFLTPPRPREVGLDLPTSLEGRHERIEHKGRSIACWSWGPDTGPTVILAHGWGGSAQQMYPFVPSLIDAGYRVVAYDQPAHGASDGTLTGLPVMAVVLRRVAEHFGEVEAVIAHSFGGPATALAIAQGLSIKRTVLISPPADLLGMTRRFARWLWLPEKVRREMQKAVEERFNMRWSEIEPKTLARRLSSQALIIHDRDDRIVPWTEGQELAHQWPGARLLVTHGYGHGRILRASGTVQAVTDFVVGDSSVTSIADPEVPYPAPMY